ncbi:hypothetical protein BDB00DRAFT_827273 [Zychaea mexicana]|uniref:uncharacterized protein n=1 Tax=Zychaea mexicana TaxID=64656 RepID=UPI0022FF3395|nr:uncharacterized protein BDB00DRAFT_827273 [Zychaea mexicana]KAI9492590.1 hypothetical protein BDB00DRAFT_827273 [Zychaea mexicana]
MATQQNLLFFSLFCALHTITPKIQPISPMNRLSRLLSTSTENKETGELVRSIEQATDAKSEQEDWRLFIHVCNAVIRMPSGPKTARKVLQQRLAVTKEPQAHVLALSVCVFLVAQHSTMKTPFPFFLVLPYDHEKTHSKFLFYFAIYKLLRAISENCVEFDAQLQDKGLLRDLNTLWNDPSTHIKVRQKMTECIQLWITQYQNNPAMQNLIQFCATATSSSSCSGSPGRAAPPKGVVANNSAAVAAAAAAARAHDGKHREQQQRRLVFRWRTTKGVRQKEEKNNIEGRRRSVDFYKEQQEDRMEVQQPIIEEAKTTAECLSQLLLTNGKSRQDDELIQEIYRKCKDLHATIMRSIEESHTPVQISSLIDANGVLVQALETYHAVTQSDLMRVTTDHHCTPSSNNNNNKKNTDGSSPVTMLSDKALG